MEDFLNFLDGFNFHTLISLLFILWYFTREIRKEIKEAINAIRQETATQATRSDRLYEMFIHLLDVMRVDRKNSN